MGGMQQKDAQEAVACEMAACHASCMKGLQAGGEELLELRHCAVSCSSKRLSLQVPHVRDGGDAMGVLTAACLA
jgi:hypothetical protein